MLPINRLHNLNPFPTGTKATPPKLEIAVISNGDGWTVPMAIKKIEEQTKGKVKPIGYYVPSNINSNALDNEIMKVLKHIEDNKLHNKQVSRAEAFMQIVKSGEFEAPWSLKVIKNIQDQAKQMDCIFLPGGEDVPPVWYGMAVHRNNESFYRSLVELTLIQEARHNGIPLMGVCRGHQVVHVYYGKKLEQSVDNQYGIQTFKLLNKDQKGLLADLFRNELRGRVMHHQGVSIAEGTNGEGDLEPLTSADGLIKAAESKFGTASPIILTQFHPECYDSNDYYSDLTKNNGTIFKILHDSANTRNLKRTHITPKALMEGRKNLRPMSSEPRAPIVRPVIKKTPEIKKFKLSDLIDQVRNMFASTFNLIST